MPTLAAALVGAPTSFVSADVALGGGETVVGSFTVGGLTYAVNNGKAALVAVSSDLQQVTNSQNADDSRVAPMLASGQAVIPASVDYDGVAYDVTSVGPYAFYLSGVTSVALPASVSSVDSRAFRSSDVERVEVDAENPNLASFDGALYSADQTSLLLIPEGRTGAVRIPSHATLVDLPAFSHCAGVDAIVVDAGCSHLSSEDGLLYSADGATLLRVPAGATEITVRDGCTAIAPGAMEGCAKLERINAPASVTSISPDVFESVPTVSLPAQTAVQDATNLGVASSLLDQANASADSVPQLTAIVALSAVDDDLPVIDPSALTVYVAEEAAGGVWEALGMAVAVDAEAAIAESASTYATVSSTLVGNGALMYSTFTGSYHPAITHSSPAAYWSASGQSVQCLNASWGVIDTITVQSRAGCTFAGWSVNSVNPSAAVASGNFAFSNTTSLCANWSVQLTWSPNGGHWGSDPSATGVQTVSARNNTTMSSYDNATLPVRPGYSFKGWSTSSNAVSGSATITVPNSPATYYAAWEPVDFDIGFDTDSEPGDADYPGEVKPDESATIDSGQVPIEDPKRPGYVFEGWVIPTEDGAEAIDQELVYQDEADGKWYVDASKLPDYAGDDGKVELTARWTAALSVDAPISATFMYDLSAWDGTETRDAYVEGSSTVKNRSAVPIRVGGIESAAGDAASVLKRSDGTTLADAPQGDAAKVLSVFPTTSAATGTEGDAKAPASDDVADDLAHKVDMALSDVKLEAAFDHGAWAVDAATVGDNGVTVSTGDLKLGYRLNLGSATGVTLDQDALLAVTGDPDSGAVKDAAIANLTYCFAAEGLIPTGSKSDPLWVEVTDPEVGSVGVYGLSDIKRAADDFSSRVDPATDPNDQDAIYTQLAASPYFELFRQLLEHDVSFQVEVDGRYLPLQLLGIAQDTKTADGKRAGLTFQMRDIYALNNTRSNDAGGGTFSSYMNPTNTNSGGWDSSALRRTLQSTFWGYLPTEVQNAIVGVDKYQQLPVGTDASKLGKTTGETVWLPSMYEVYGATFPGYNESEALTANGNVPFQYMAYQGSADPTANAKAIKTYSNSTNDWWLRSAHQNDTYYFCSVNSGGTRSCGDADITHGAVPCFCL